MVQFTQNYGSTAAAAAPSAGDIARAWSVHRDDTGNAYFFNSLTGASQWTAPDGFQPQQQQQPQPGNDDDEDDDDDDEEDDDDEPAVVATAPKKGGSHGGKRKAADERPRANLHVYDF